MTCWGLAGQATSMLLGVAALAGNLGPALVGILDPGPSIRDRIIPNPSLWKSDIPSPRVSSSQVEGRLDFICFGFVQLLKFLQL